ncbi:MAG TPA: hypothetical protein VGK23_02395, partial [Methanomassiliicoccales archaeon]
MSEGKMDLPGKTIIIKKAVTYDGPIRIVVTACPKCGRRLMKGMTKCPKCDQNLQNNLVLINDRA